VTRSDKIRTRAEQEQLDLNDPNQRRLSVGAKAVASTSTRAGRSSTPPKIRGKLYEALSKNADHDRLISVELNRAEIGTPGEFPDWAQHVESEIVQAESELTIRGQPAPAAYVVVTNRGFLNSLDAERWTETATAYRYKIKDLIP
jgi:hypothetical protein